MIIRNQCKSLQLKQEKYIQVYNILGENFRFPTRWFSPNEDMHTSQRILTTDEPVVQFQRLFFGRVLALEAILTVRNVFKFFLEDLNPNSLRVGNNQEVTQSVAERLEEPMNFFYHYCGMKLRPFALLEFRQEKRARRGTDLLIVFTDPRIADGTWANWGCEDNSSETDNTMHKFNEAMDIDALMGKDCKKHKTSARVPKRAYRLPLMRITLPPASGISPVALIVKKMPIKVGEDFFSSLYLLLSEVNALGLRYTKARNNELADTKARNNKIMNDNEIINKKQGVLTERLAIMDIKEEVCGAKLTSEGEAYNFRGRAEEGHCEALYRAGSFALANCFRGCSFSPMNLVFTAESFALANCFKGCSSLPRNLVFPTRSFTPANYFKAYGSSPANLFFTTESFALTNCFRGCGSSFVNIFFTTGSFALTNCFSGCGSSPANLVFTAGSFALANCFRGYGSSPTKPCFYCWELTVLEDTDRHLRSFFLQLGALLSLIVSKASALRL
ncbi:hypothetical protein GOBAR_AA00177 [Gossypium barbadense]|uniref:Uncharacterized protein n=1 Tax=Gossypium barbadense TaxID=3634 RepID=A0A2P5YXR8_GOSBA|nr:hypothetical protein GOBAR_AA00177 [Gossypium barbadense]